MIYTIINKEKQKIISRNARVADNFFLRAIGLMFRKRITEDEALMFYKAPCIHTFFMRFPIDIVFLNKKMQIIRIVLALRPFRAIVCARSYLTLELPSHTSLRNGLKLGDTLDLIPLESAKGTNSRTLQRS
jgi:uncharacterized membrane protein (UPF0127 family)